MTAHWQQRPEAGGDWLIRFFAGASRRIGRRGARVALVPIALYFLLVRSAERRASRDFLARVLNRPVTWRDTARHFLTFAQVVLDRLFLLTTPQAFAYTVDDVSVIHNVLDTGRGLILFGAHLGSFDAARLFQRQRPDVPLRILIDREVNARTSAVFDALGSQLDQQIIDRRAGGVSVALQIADTLNNAGLVAILADRHVLGESTLTVEFLGAPVQLPSGPFELAVVTGGPVLVFLGLYTGGNHYRLVFQPIEIPQRKHRKDRAVAVQSLAQQFADTLAEHVRAWPYNWFNFFDFWAANPSQAHD